MEKVDANKVGTILYIDAPKNKFIPAYVYYMLEAYKCTGVCFGGSKHIYKQAYLKGKKDWKDVIKNEPK